MATTNFVFMTVNIYNSLNVVNTDEDKDKGKGHGHHEVNKDLVEATVLTPNPDSSTFLLDMDNEEDEDKNDNGTIIGSATETSIGWDEPMDSRPKNLPLTETFCSILSQILIPFLLAGCGVVGAGLVLDYVTFSPVFQEVPQIWILIPALLGLKGNIEMTLASRLSTEANMGRLTSTRSKVKHILGNIYIVQFQAITVGLVASLSPYWMGTPPEGWDEVLMLSASSVAATSIVSFFLGIFMSLVVIIAWTHDINPDNVAAPVAASVGDIVTLAVLFVISSVIHANKDDLPWLSRAILCFYLVTLPCWFWLAYQKTFSRKVLMSPSTWLPILGAMLISCFAGKIFDHSVKLFQHIAVLQPVINGVGGNIAAVQASRISTHLHCFGGPEGKTRCRNPLKTFYQGIHSKSALALMLLLVPGHLLFLTLIWCLQTDFEVSLIFLLIYILAAALQVIFLLYLADVVVLYFWNLGVDPDNAAIPCLTSSSDFLGTTLLILAFQLMLILQPSEGSAEAIDFVSNSTSFFYS